MKKTNFILILIFGHSLAVFASTPERERAVKQAENSFFRQFAQLKDAENTLLRTYNNYLISHCAGRSDQGPVDPFITPDRNNDTEGHNQHPSPRPLGPRDYHIVPPGPTQDYRKTRPSGVSDPHVWSPGSTSETSQQPSPFGPRAPRPTQDYRKVRPLGPRDYHVVPPGPTLDPTLHRSSFGPRHRQILPPGPRRVHESQERGEHYGQVDGQQPRSEDFAGCSSCIPGTPGERGATGVPGLPGLVGLQCLSDYDIRKMMIERGQTLCEQRYACQKSN